MTVEWADKAKELVWKLNQGMPVWKVELDGDEERYALWDGSEMMRCLHCQRVYRLREVRFSPRYDEPFILCAFEDCSGTALDLWRVEVLGGAA